VSIANSWYEISDDGAPAGAIQWAFLLSFLPPLQGSLIRSSPPRAYAGLLSFRPFGPKYQKYAALSVSAAQGLKIKTGSYFILYTGVFPLETWSISLYASETPALRPRPSKTRHIYINRFPLLPVR
jgi:hypothetical protein